jgi:hypothetical protein
VETDQPLISSEVCTMLGEKKERRITKRKENIHW